MGSEVGNAGMTPEQKAGLAAGAAIAVAGIAFSMVRRNRKQQSPVQTTADRIVENPSLKNLYSTARHTLEEARGKVDPKTLESAKKELARQVEVGSSTWHSDVEPAARELAARALQTAQRFRVEGADRSRDLAKRWEKDYGPAARSLADEAVAEADEIIASARKRATAVSDVARKEYLPKIGPMAAAAGGAIASAVSDRSTKVQKEMKRSGYRPQFAIAKDLRKRGGVREQPGVVKRAGQGVLNFTGQLFMITFWAAALGAVVYYGLLNEERREKVRSFLTDAYEQVSELIEDFQDEDVFGESEATERF